MVRHLLLINMFLVFEAVISRLWEIGSNSIAHHASFLYRLKADFLRAKASFLIHSLLRLTGIVRQSIFLRRVKLVACQTLLLDLKLFPTTKRSANERSATQFKMVKSVNLMIHRQLKSTLSWLKKLMEMRTTKAFLLIQHNQKKHQLRYLLPRNRLSILNLSLPLKMTVQLQAIIKWRH